MDWQLVHKTSHKSERHFRAFLPLLRVTRSMIGGLVDKDALILNQSVSIHNNL
jgi:predicted DNA-binding helix-hairpin-helix protein